MMKTYILMALLVFTAGVSAQEVKPKLEQFGEMVRATYYYDNGQVQQQGYFKDGKLEGQWVAYDAAGNKKAVAEYSNGNKTGQWVFWNDASLSEVNYSDSRVASVKRYTSEVLVKN
ncbi:MAG TPA: membrane-binding protein [Flavobacterium sp.]|jgi:antitoxin component YwqK of YwqJK toxin-antitoxin module